MQRRTRLGRIGEQLAARHLERAGMEILARNWRPRASSLRGELDLVARDGRTLVVCEVKARRGHAAGHPLQALTPAKQAQLRRLAGALLCESPALGGGPVRIDAVAVTWRDGGGRPEIEHVRDVR